MSLAERKRLAHVLCKLHADCNLSSVLQRAAVKEPLGFEINAPLAPIMLSGETVLLDGAHGVDVLCHDGDRGLAIEAKLGARPLDPRSVYGAVLGTGRAL